MNVLSTFLVRGWMPLFVTVCTASLFATEDGGTLDSSSAERFRELVAYLRSANSRMQDVVVAVEGNVESTVPAEQVSLDHPANTLEDLERELTANLPADDHRVEIVGQYVVVTVPPKRIPDRTIEILANTIKMHSAGFDLWIEGNDSFFDRFRSPDGIRYRLMQQGAPSGSLAIVRTSGSAGDSAAPSIQMVFAPSRSTSGSPVPASTPLGSKTSGSNNSESWRNLTPLQDPSLATPQMSDQVAPAIKEPVRAALPEPQVVVIDLPSEQLSDQSNPSIMGILTRHPR